VVPIARFRPRHAVLVNPGAQVSTAAVFQEYHRTARETVGDRCRNHLTAAAMKLAPVIAEVLDELERQPDSEFACMSGSGATCFGLFPSADQAASASRSIEIGHPGWWCRATRLS
jgi:4-diphosphocytidyl-2-C-methyl-D-erythritol kinase